MKTAKVTIAGREYPVCYSTEVVCRCEETFGSSQAVFDKMGSKKLSEKLGALTWLTAQMLEAGWRYARWNKENADTPPTEETLRDLIGLDDVVTVQTALLEAVIGDAARDVEANPPKNATATPLPQ